MSHRVYDVVVIGARIAGATVDGRQRCRGGDAGLHLDPWTEYGMGFAGTHATFLAEALLELFRGGSRGKQALATYHERRNDHALPIYQYTLTVGLDLRRMAPPEDLTT